MPLPISDELMAMSDMTFQRSPFFDPLSNTNSIGLNARWVPEDEMTVNRFVKVLVKDVDGRPYGLFDEPSLKMLMNAEITIGELAFVAARGRNLTADLDTEFQAISATGDFLAVRALAPVNEALGWYGIARWFYNKEIGRTKDFTRFMKSMNHIGATFDTAAHYVARGVYLPKYLVTFIFNKLDASWFPALVAYEIGAERAHKFIAELEDIGITSDDLAGYHEVGIKDEKTLMLMLRKDIDPHLAAELAGGAL